MEQNKELQSRIINFLRFPLIVGVVFLHNYSLSDDTIIRENLPYYSIASELFSHIFARVSVPFFFVISGFLYFYSSEYNKEVYLKKLKSRCKSLLLPYLFWNIMVYFLYYYITFHTDIVLGKNSVEPTLNYFFDCFIGKPFPVAYQFWFIKDLMVLVLISPIIYFMTKYGKALFILALWVLWVLGGTIPYLKDILGLNSLLFFSVGAWLSINRHNLIQYFKRISLIGYLYPIIVIIDLLTIKTVWHLHIQNIGITLAIIFWFNIVRVLLERRVISDTPFLASASFFVFAVHDPWLLTILNKSLYKLGIKSSDWLYTLQYFIVVVAVIIIALSIYAILRKYLPRFTSLITGSR